MGCVPVVFANLPWLHLVWASSTHQQKRECQRESGPRLRASPVLRPRPPPIASVRPILTGYTGRFYSEHAFKARGETAALSGYDLLLRPVSPTLAGRAESMSRGALRCVAH